MTKEINEDIEENEVPQKVAAKQQKIKVMQEQEKIELMSLRYVIIKTQNSNKTQVVTVLLLLQGWNEKA